LCVSPEILGVQARFCAWRKLQGNEGLVLSLSQIIGQFSAAGKGFYVTGKTVGEVAKLLGVSQYTIYGYEQLGIVSPKRDRSGYRRYTDAHIEAIRAHMATRKMHRQARDESSQEA
jgi:hypothetical protein